MPALHTDSLTTQWLTYGARRHFANYDHSVAVAMGILFRAPEFGSKPKPCLLSKSLASFRCNRSIRYIIGQRKTIFAIDWFYCFRRLAVSERTPFVVSRIRNGYESYLIPLSSHLFPWAISTPRKVHERCCFTSVSNFWFRKRKSQRSISLAKRMLHFVYIILSLRYATISEFD